MKRAIILVWLAAQCCLANGEDIRKKVGDAKPGSVSTTTIDPEKHVFGIPFDTSEDDVIKRIGRPDGYILLQGHESAMIYGKDMVLLFNRGRLSGVRISGHVLDWPLSERMARNKAFDDIENRWQLDNGIKPEMSLTRVKQILGDKLHEENHGYQHRYVTRTASIWLGFAHYTSEGEGDEAHRLYSVTVERAR